MPLPSVYRETLPVLFLAGLGLVTAGLLLQQMKDVLYKTPGLLVMVPALIALRGGISGAMGSRLGSAIHMGLMGKGNLLNPEAWQNVLAAFILSVVLSLLVGALSHVTSLLLGLGSAGLLKLVLIATVAGTAAGVIQIGITFGIILIAFTWGLDPDNVTTPSLATVGDMITILLLLLVSSAMEGIS